MASRYSTNLHQRDRNQERTQLFSQVGSYNPAQVLNSSSSSRSSTPYQTATSESNYYSDAVLQQLESQNDEQIEGLSAKVKMLKDITVKIGDEVRDSSKFLNSMEENFDNARASLKGTFGRMIRMSQRSGVGWRAWLLLFAFIFLCFFYVWWK